MTSQEVKQKEYEIIYKKGIRGKEDIGSLAAMAVGDVIQIYDDGYYNYVIGKLTGSKWTRKIRTKSFSLFGELVIGSKLIDPRTILKVSRVTLKTEEPKNEGTDTK